MELATKSVSFGFNDTMYRQVDGIFMGSPLGVIFANIFVGFYEKLLFDRFLKPYIYLCYVDDTFACFCSCNETFSFFHCLNDLHRSLTFTMDEEKDNKLPFSDVLIERRWTRHAGHCWRSRDELIRDVLLWTPTHGRAKAGRPARTYIQQLCEDTGCCPEDLPRTLNDREEWRERVRDICATSAIWWWWWWWWWWWYIDSLCLLVCIRFGKLLLLSPGSLTWPSVSHSGFLRLV